MKFVILFVNLFADSFSIYFKILTGFFQNAVNIFSVNLGFSGNFLFYNSVLARKQIFIQILFANLCTVNLGVIFCDTWGILCFNRFAVFDVVAEVGKSCVNQSFVARFNRVESQIGRNRQLLVVDFLRDFLDFADFGIEIFFLCTRAHKEYSVLCRCSIREITLVRKHKGIFNIMLFLCYGVITVMFFIIVNRSIVIIFIDKYI